MNAAVWDKMSRDDLLIRHQQLKDDLTKAKEAEMVLRKYLVNRVFPNKTEGVNTVDLGNGYQLKAGVKFNYNLKASNQQIKDTLDRIAKVGNRGNVVAERIISWTPNFLLTEYRILQDDAKDGSPEAKEILKLVNEVLEITDAAPTLDIKAPKVKA